MVGFSSVIYDIQSARSECEGIKEKLKEW